MDLTTDTPPVIVKRSENGHSTSYFRLIAFIFVGVTFFLLSQSQSHALRGIQPGVTAKANSFEESTEIAATDSKQISYSYEDYNSCEPTTSAPLDYTEAKQEAWNKWLEGRFLEKVTSYQQLWNFTTHSIHIPNKHPHDPPTSLEMLQDILQDHNDFEFVTKHSTDIPECFRPRLEMTQKLVDCGCIPLAYPILNLGFPKAGSSTLWRFFQCTFKGKGSEGVTHHMEGRCIREGNVDVKEIFYANVAKRTNVDEVHQYYG
jgi:hypothetical protein